MALAVGDEWRLFQVCGVIGLTVIFHVHTSCETVSSSCVFECLALQQVRRPYLQLFRGTDVVPCCVQSFMNRSDQLMLVNFIWNVARYRLRGLPGP